MTNQWAFLDLWELLSTFFTDFLESTLVDHEVYMIFAEVTIVTIVEKKFANVKYEMSKGAKLGGASGARAPPLFLSRPKSIYMSRFFRVKITPNFPLCTTTF